MEREKIMTMIEGKNGTDNMLTISECSMLLSELSKSIDRVITQGLSIDKQMAHSNYNTAYYKRLVRLHDKINAIFIKLQDELCS